MKRLGLIVVVLMVAVVLYRPATSQDNYGERIASLETRVAVLEGSGGHTMVGAFVVIGDATLITNEEGRGPDDGCRGVGEYAGFGLDSPVLVSDYFATVGEGGVVQTIAAVEGDRRIRCEMRFRVEGLPMETTYAITVAPLASTEVTFAELERLGWDLTITIDESL